jgi:hypothetical protein
LEIILIAVFGDPRQLCGGYFIYTTNERVSLGHGTKKVRGTLVKDFSYFCGKAASIQAAPFRDFDYPIFSATPEKVSEH